MNSKGYMRISREIENWGWYRDANTFRVFFHLLLKAQYQAGEYMGIPIQRGQVITGRKLLAAELNISEQGVRTAIDHLINSGEIVRQSTNKFSIITICKFDSWQELAETANQQSNHQINQPTNQRNNHIQIIEENNNKKNKEDKKKKSEPKFDVRADLSYVDMFYVDVWNEWLDYKDEINKQYKTQRGAKAAFTELMNLSGGDVATAQAIIEQSFKKNWDGFFALKTSQNLPYNMPMQPRIENESESNEQQSIWQS